MATAPIEAPMTGLPADWRDFLALTKPRVMTLVVFTGLCGLLAAPGHIHPVLGFTAILCIALGAGAAAALNQWYEADLDAKMKRTAQPPAACRADGALSRRCISASGWASFSVLLMGLAVNLLSAAILAVSILFYVLIYTVWLKRRTPQNIVIGGAAGAFPPLIGWAAATGRVDLLPVLLFAARLPVDAAAFLGARAVRETRLRRCRRADAAGGGGRRVRRGCRSCSTRLPMAAVAIAPWPLGLAGADLRRRRGGAQRGVPDACDARRLQPRARIRR